MAASPRFPGVSDGRHALIPGVICCGNIVFDILVRPVEEIAWNQTRWVESLDTSLGGNGANTASAIATLGVPVKLLGFTGRDSFAEAALSRLKGAGVDLGFVTQVEAPTPTTVVLVRENGDRMFLHRPGASAEAFSNGVELGRDCLDGAAYFHLANAFALPHMRVRAAETLKLARDAGLTTSMDAGWDSKGRWIEDLAAALPFTDLLFVNEDEALHLAARTEDYAAAADCLRKLGAGSVIVKRGAAGCAVLTDGGIVRSPAFEVNAVDTTGAGDAFAGGFLAALARGYSIIEAARIANAVGALVVQKVGATTGLLSWDETLASMRRQRG